MSLILDALNRSESERSTTDSVPGIQTVHDVAEDNGHSIWRRALWPALLTALAVIAFLLWQGRAETGANPIETVEEPAAVAVGAEAVSAPAGTAAKVAKQPSAPAQGKGSGPAPVPEPAPISQANVLPETADPDVAALYRTAQATAPARSQASDTPRRQASARQTVRAEDPPAIEEPGLDVDALTAAANDALAERQVADEPVIEHEAPFIADLRQSVKDQIPSIFYSAHNWATNPAQRSVVLNGEVRRAGQQIKPGLKLVEILEGSIVLDFNGTEFRLRSLNSWVNL